MCEAQQQDVRHGGLIMGRRAAAATIAVLVGIGTLVPGGAPSGAQAPPPEPVWLAVDSDPGEYIGDGREWSYTPEVADFRVYTYDRSVRVVVAGEETWRLRLDRPSSQPQLAVGRYPVVPIQDRGPADAGLDISADGRSCGADDMSGWFEIDDIAYADGAVTRLAMRFEHTCAPEVDPGGGTLRGEVRWDGSAPLPTNYISPSPIPPSFPSAPAGALPAEGNALWLDRWQAGGDPDGPPAGTTGPFEGLARRTTESGTVIEGSSPRPVETITLYLKLQFQLSSRQPTLLPGLYEDLGGIRQNPTLGGFSLWPGGDGICSDGSRGTDVAVDEVDVSEDGYDDLALRWTVSCPDTGLLEQGQARWQTPAPAGAPGTPTGVAAVAGSDTTVVSWVPPASGPAPTGYVVTTYVDGLADETPTTAGPGATSVEVPTPGTGLHTFKVAAVGTAGTGWRSPASAPVAVPGPDLGPFATIPAFVRQQFRDFAGRQPTRAELDSVGATLARGEVTPQEVVRDLRGRATLSTRRAAVSRLYRAAFGRAPDATGLAYWVQRLASGTSMGRVASSFVASPELRRLYGSLSNAAFVDRVYRNVLGRAADADGRAFWIDQLGRGRTRGNVLLSFAVSAEHVARTATEVERVVTFVAMVGRVPSAAELIGRPTPRVSPSASLVRNLLASNEYAARFD